MLPAPSERAQLKDSPGKLWCSGLPQFAPLVSVSDTEHALLTVKPKKEAGIALARFTVSVAIVLVTLPV